MNFGQSISTCLRKYATFEGTASRPEYWWFMLFLVLGCVVTAFVGQWLQAIFSLATLLPAIAATTRRLHDTDRSGWWQLISFVPIVGGIVLLVFCCQATVPSNRFDRGYVLA